MKAVWFGRHLYELLLYLDSNIVEISPSSLNKGERQFVEDLKAFHDRNADYFKTKGLYLLRNLSKGRGVGFFEAGNFHPDFILWLLMGDRQPVILVLLLFQEEDQDTYIKTMSETALAGW